MSSDQSSKVIDADALKFIENSILTDPHQDLLFKAWTPIFYIDQKVKSRLLVLTNFRLSVIKDSFPGFSLRQTFLLLNLRSINYRPPTAQAVNGNAQLVLTFSKDEQQSAFGLQTTQHGDFIIHMPEKRIQEILWPILFSAQSVRHGRGALDIRVPAELLVGYQRPMPDEQDGLLAAYLAECDRCGTPRRFGVIDHFLACFQYNDHTLNLSHALKFLDVKDLTRDILAIISAIKYFPWFSTILSFGLPLRDSLNAIATLFEEHSSLQTLILCHAKVTQKGLQALGTALSTGNHQLHTFSLSDCDLDDQGLTTICEGLQQSKRHTIQELCLAGCGFSSKGVKALCKLFSSPSFASTLRVLDISRNKLGKQGTEFLTQLLSPTSPTYQQIRLESLQVDNTDLDTDKFLSSLKHSHLPDTCLQSIDLSANRFTKTGISTLGSIITQSRTLYSVTLTNCSLEAKSVLEIINAARRNQHNVEFALGFANNNLGPRGAKEFESFYSLKPMTKEEITSRHTTLHKQIQETGVGASLQGHQFFFDMTATSSKDETQNNFHIMPSDNGSYIPLDSIDLSDNNLGNEGIVYICRAFQVIRIKSLAIDRNFKVSTFFSKANEAQVALERFVLETTTLEEFSIAGDDKNYYLGQYLTGLLKALAATRLKLRYLDISGNRCGDHAMMALSQYILNNSSFEALLLDDNRIGHDGLNSLLQAIKTAPHFFNLTLPVHDFDRLLKDRNVSAQHAAIQALWNELNLVLDSRDEEKDDTPAPVPPESLPPTHLPEPTPVSTHPSQTPQVSSLTNQFHTLTGSSVKLGQKLPPPPTLTPTAYNHAPAIATGTTPQAVQIKSTAGLQDIQLTGAKEPIATEMTTETVPMPLQQPQTGRRPTVGRRASIIQQRTARFQLGGGTQADVINAYTSAAQRQAQSRNMDFTQNELESFDKTQLEGVPTTTNIMTGPSPTMPLPAAPIHAVHGYQPPVTLERSQVVVGSDHAPPPPVPNTAPPRFPVLQPTPSPQSSNGSNGPVGGPQYNAPIPPAQAIGTQAGGVKRTVTIHRAPR
jgi:Ran GTPase-activating protein (RanGAP) involved in mRNA processing and transport